ncbi:MAG: phosphoribosylaminoimidazolesuccinocarboxamide synthase [Chloroflexota bacterium]
MTLLTTNLPNPLHKGKVRDTYDLGKGLLLMVATDRISAFDVVMPNGIPDKGYILSQMSRFWFEQTGRIVPNHFVGMADDPAALGPVAEHPTIKALPPGIARQAMVVKRAERIDVECVVRAYLTGSALVDYRKSGSIFSIPVPGGLVDGSQLPQLLFTPTTKAEAGHDEPMTMEQVRAQIGDELARQVEALSFAIFRFAHDFARPRGIILADTKFEFGIHAGRVILIDEVLTPDSSRFWDAEGYAPGRSQPNYDKQFVRDWLLTQPWDKTPPSPALPDDIVRKTRERYLEAYRRLSGTPLL